MPVDSRTVFVIHGRNEAARKALFEFLRSLGLNPLEWSQAIAMTGQGSPYIGDVLNAAFGAASAIVVLQTPDDIAHLHESLTYPGDPECSPQMQPRPNVLFEAGMAMGRNPDRTVIVELGQVKNFSDIHGRHVVRLDNSTQKRQELATRLRTAGCSVNTDATDWHTAGDLTPPSAPGGGLPMGRRLPSSEASGRPRLSARLNDRGGSKLSDVIVTNNGPGDILDLEVNLASDEDENMYRRDDIYPLPILPQGKSIVALQRMPLGLGQSSRPYFNVVITGRTADGSPIEQTEFVSGA